MTKKDVQDGLRACEYVLETIREAAFHRKASKALDKQPEAEEAST
jgi:hypothetical protein